MFPTLASRHKIIALVIVLAACVVGVVLAVGYYPIASVNGTLISASAFRTELGAARTYSQQARTVYQDIPTSTIQFAAANDTDLSRIVLDTMVENVLVEKGIQAVVGTGSSHIVDDKIATYTPQGELAGASQTLFGLSEGAFREYILLPQAEREVLGSKLFLTGSTLAIWTKEARTTAHVRIFSPQFGWDGTQVVAR